jgi:hypothetical protein
MMSVVRVPEVAFQGRQTSVVNATNSKPFELKSLKTPTNLRRVQMPKIVNIPAASYAPPSPVCREQ